MAKHLRNVQCPKCRELGKDKSKNNLGMYDDGSGYCWSCGYYIHGNSLKNYVSTNKHVCIEKPSVCLPPDSDVYIPAVARNWLGKYSFSEYEIIHNKILWSEYRQQLIFPYFDKYGNLLAWQGRSFGKDAKYKWYSQGDLINLFYILPKDVIQYKCIVLVEDIVSAIAVARTGICAMPLFGNNVSNRLKRLYRLTNHLILWLDPDMKKKMLLEASKAREMGFTVSTVFTEKDPKEFQTNETLIILKEHLYK